MTQLYMIEGKQRLHTARTISQAFMMSPEGSSYTRLKDIPIESVAPGVKIYGYVLINETTLEYLCGRHSKGAPYMSATDAPRYYKSTRERDATLTFRALVSI